MERRKKRKWWIIKFAVVGDADSRTSVEATTNRESRNRSRREWNRVNNFNFSLSFFFFYIRRCFFVFFILSTFRTTTKTIEFIIPLGIRQTIINDNRGEKKTTTETNSSSSNSDNRRNKWFKSKRQIGKVTSVNLTDNNNKTTNLVEKIQVI